MDDNVKESLIEESHDPLIRYLNKAVVFSVKVLAVMMVLIIWIALADVLIHMYRELEDPLKGLFNLDRLLLMLGNFLVVLIAIEIFLNIIFYLKKDAIHVPLVLATALTAIARKVIIFDYAAVSPMYLVGVASVVLSLGITYWLITKKEN